MFRKVLMICAQKRDEEIHTPIMVEQIMELDLKVAITRRALQVLFDESGSNDEARLLMMRRLLVDDPKFEVLHPILLLGPAQITASVRSLSLTPRDSTSSDGSSKTSEKESATSTNEEAIACEDGGRPLAVGLTDEIRRVIGRVGGRVHAAHLQLTHVQHLRIPHRTSQ